tara:strand:- start:4209 stop:4517 length:309 start_codon:yes stop_codon:yes gene_type:complete
MNLKFKNQHGIKYTVRFKKPDARKCGQCVGFCYFPKNREADIEVSPLETNQTIFNTVIHEVTHAFFEDKNETEVTKFASTLSRLLFNELNFKNKNLKQLIKE